MLREIFTWWLGQMRTLLPGSAARAGRLPDALIVDVTRMPEADSPLAGSLLMRRDGQMTKLQPLDTAYTQDTASGLPVLLRLPPGAVLSREVVLPLAAARDLSAVVGFEMDRLTPFSADELYWSVSNVAQDRARAKLRLRLSIVLRAPVEALLAPLARLGLAPSSIEAETGRIALIATTRRAAGRMQMALTILCAALALACVAVPVWRQQAALNAAAQAVADASPAARVAAHLRQQLSVTESGRAAVATARQGDALRVLSTLTDALPDGTWLSDLTLKSGDLTFDGQSANAAKLIGLLSAVPDLHSPSFTAPVTRTSDGTADLFSLHATVAAP